MSKTKDEALHLDQTTGGAKKQWNLHPYTIIFAMMILAAVLTWVIPAGQFDRVLDEATGREIAVAGTYHSVEANQVDPIELVQTIVGSMIGAGDLIVFILILGGAFGIFSSTGAVDALMARIITAFSGKAYSRFVFPLLLLFLFTCASTFGLGEEAMIFTPFLVVAAIALGYDAMTAVAVMIFSIALGYTGATTNPYNLGIAQSIAGLPLYSGLWFRLIIFGVVYGIAAWYILRYAKKIKKDPSKSLVADIDYSSMMVHDDPSKIVMTGKHKRVLAVFGISFGFMIFAIIRWAWWIDSLSGLFLVTAVLVGLANGYGVNRIADEFVNGAKTMLMAALLIAFARTISGILSEGMILDTIIYGLTQPLSNVPNLFVGPLMVLLQSVINITIPSASAMAVVTMPIMVPIADVLEIQRQTAVIAFQFGDGITNLLMPYWDVLVIALGLANVPFQRWFRFVLPLVGILMVVALIMTGIAEYVKVGPF